MKGLTREVANRDPLSAVRLYFWRSPSSLLLLQSTFTAQFSSNGVIFLNVCHPSLLSVLTNGAYKPSNSTLINVQLVVLYLATQVST